MNGPITTLCTAAALAFALPAFAGDADGCHFHGNKAASQETVSGCAVKRQQALITGGKIDKSWQAIKPAALVRCCPKAMRTKASVPLRQHRILPVAGQRPRPAARPLQTNRPAARLRLAQNRL